MEAHGVKALDEHLILTPNKWSNSESELGYPTILEELFGNGSIRLGGSFEVERFLLQQFKTFGNMGHPFSNGDGEVTNCAYNLGHNG